MLELEYKSKTFFKLSVIEEICSWLQTSHPSDPRGMHRHTHKQKSKRNMQKNVRTAYVCAYHCAQLSYTTQHRAVLSIFPLILQPSTRVQMLSIGGDNQCP